MFTFSVQTGKPGSVCDDHLSRRNISNTFKPSPKARGPRYAFPRRCSGWGLQGRYVSTPPVSSYLAFSSLPLWGGFLFCCTFLKVAFTGNCPAPCPVEPGLSSCAVLSYYGARDRLGLPEKHSYFNNKIT